MVPGVVELTGERLVLEDKVGHVTRVGIWLPAVKQLSEQSSKKEHTVMEPTESLRILVVDDDGIILFNTATMLTDLGYRVFEAISGIEALRVLESEEIDLLITDFTMPKMNGAELASQAQALNPALKVIMASGYIDLPDGTTLAAHRVGKPFTEDDLVQAIAVVTG